MATREPAEPDIGVRPDYLDLPDPLVDGFDWLEFSTVHAELAAKATFLVLFVSEQRDDLSDEDKQLLHSLDAASHSEAQQSDALIKYFSGTVDERGRALSWCLWSDRQMAAKALHGAAHKQAIRLAREGKFYTTYAALFFAVAVDPATGLSFTPIANHHNLKKEHTHANV